MVHLIFLTNRIARGCFPRSGVTAWAGSGIDPGETPELGVLKVAWMLTA